MNRRWLPRRVPIPVTMISYPSHTLWLTGLSGAGQSTLSRRVAAHLREHGIPVCILDGDELRSGVSPDLGFRREDRSENCRRTAEIAKLLNSQGIHRGRRADLAICGRPPARARDRRRRSLRRDLSENRHRNLLRARSEAPLRKRRRRARRRSSQASPDPYEVPVSPDLVIETGALDRHRFHRPHHRVRRTALRARVTAPTQRSRAPAARVPPSHRMHASRCRRAHRSRRRESRAAATAASGRRSHA